MTGSRVWMACPRCCLLHAGDSVVERIFDTQPNDLIVLTLGMSAWGGALQVPAERYLSFPATKGVMHTQYFQQAESRQKLIEWLS